MSETLTIALLEIVGSPLCVASEDGQKVHDRIAGAMREGKTVSVSFLNVTSLTSAFLNAAIGQLYGEFGPDEIRNKIKVRDIQPDDRGLLKRVVDTAKEYFKDPDRFKKARRIAMG
ncbi:MAG: STAS-like domain-containing protein [Nitrospira sp.]